MKNYLFTPRQLAILKHAGSWRFVASAFPGEVRPARHSVHDAWLHRQSDVHPHREILFVLAGSGYYGFCGKSYPARPGTVFLFDAMEPHDLQYRPVRTVSEHLWFHFTQGHCGISLLRVAATYAPQCYRVLWQRSYFLAELGLSTPQMLFPDNPPAPSAPDVRRRCASALALLTASLVEKGYRPPASGRARAGRHDDAARTVVQIILKHIHETQGRGCSLTNLARIAGYSKYHFLRLFRKHTGRSVRSFVDEERVRAFDAMLASGAPHKVIAARLGFAHSSGLCRWQRQHGF